MSSIYHVKFFKSSFKLEDDYEHISDIDKEKISDINSEAFFDFDEDDVVYSYHILRFRTNREIYHYYKKYLVNNHSVLNQFLLVL